MEFSNKKYIIFAGPNGAGKSTLFNLHSEYKNMHRVNVDEIARELGPWNDITAQLKAGRKSVSLLNSYLVSDEDFNQESTLCGYSILKNIKKAIRLGFNVEIHYVCVDSPEICKERIKHRVEQGGHGISDDDVDRRYADSLMNVKSMLNICDEVYFYDNTVEVKLIAIYRKGQAIMLCQELPAWFRNNIAPQPRG